MSVPLQRIVVIGATGPTGFYLVKELASRARTVRAVSRRREELDRLFRGDAVEIAAADALDAEATGRVVEGADLVVDCIGLPPERMADHPTTARIVSSAATAAGARCLQISSYWSFFPHQGEVVNESHPREGGHEWFQLRRRAEDIMLEAGAAVVHLPDFFGPHVHTSVVQMAVEAAAVGEPVRWMGSADTLREAAFVPDAMRIVADLAERESAYGTNWAIPGSGPLSGRRLAEIASDHLGRKVEVRGAPGWLLRLLALGLPALRTARPLIPQYVRPVRYDTGKLRSLLGEIETTPLETAIPATLDWIRETSAAGQ